MVRYLQASKAQASFGMESNPYEAAADLSDYFGLVRDDIDFPNPNPQTPMTTSGHGRNPYVNSADPREYEFDIPLQPVDSNAPLEVAFGDRTVETVNEGLENEYQRTTFTLSDRLPTMTVGQHIEDQLEAAYVGTKASASIEASQGDPLEINLSCISAKLEPEYDAPASPPPLGIPKEAPYRFWMLGGVTLSDSGDGTSVKELATVNSVTSGIDNGLEANHHGNGRDAYSISEEEDEELFDTTLGVTITDMDLYQYAYENRAPMDIEIPFYKDPTADTHREALIARWEEATITDAPAPNPGEGKIETDIEVSPMNMEIEIREIP